MKRQRRLLALSLLSAGLIAPAGAPAVAQAPAEKTLKERAKESWARLTAGLESAAKSAGDEYNKLSAEAAKATGPARERLAAQMDELSQKWAVARAKLSDGFERQAASLSDEIKRLKVKAVRATGPAREKIHEEMAQLGEDWAAAREKLAASWSSNMKAVSEEYAHLKGHASQATAEAKAKLAPKMAKLRTEWETNREKLAAYLEEDMRKTKEDMAKLGAATSDAAARAKAALVKKYEDLTRRRQALENDRTIDVVPDDPKP